MVVGYDSSSSLRSEPTPAGIPSLTHPVVSKRKLKPMLIATFITMWSFNTILGIVFSFAFMSLVNENAILNWDYFTKGVNNIFVKIVSHFIILFPSLDIISAYPLVVTTLVNNVNLVLMRRDKFESVFNWKDRIGKLIFRLFLFLFRPSAWSTNHIRRSQDFRCHQETHWVRSA